MTGPTRTLMLTGRLDGRRDVTIHSAQALPVRKIDLADGRPWEESDGQASPRSSENWAAVVDDDAERSGYPRAPTPVDLGHTDAGTTPSGRARGSCTVKVLVWAVDNVEGADLTRIELDDLHLTGVRWSEFTTRWSPGWDEPFREAFIPVGRGRGLRAIRDDPRTRDHRQTRVSV
jgi:hypothetical protein